jgi:hypothetical protein
MPRSRKQLQQLSRALALSLLPVLIPALAYFVTGGRDIQWRLVLAGATWALGSYIQVVAVTRKKRRLLVASGILYLIGVVFSFMILGPVSVAFGVLYEGFLVMLWLHHKAELPSPAEVLGPTVSILTGILLTLGVLAIRLSF